MALGAYNDRPANLEHAARNRIEQSALLAKKTGAI